MNKTRGIYHIAWDFGAIDQAFIEVLGSKPPLQKTCKTLCGKRVQATYALAYPSHAANIQCEECQNIANESEEVAQSNMRHS